MISIVFRRRYYWHLEFFRTIVYHPCYHTFYGIVFTINYIFRIKCWIYIRIVVLAKFNEWFLQLFSIKLFLGMRINQIVLYQITSMTCFFPIKIFTQKTLSLNEIFQTYSQTHKTTWLFYLYCPALFGIWNSWESHLQQAKLTIILWVCWDILNRWSIYFQVSSF